MPKILVTTPHSSFLIPFELKDRYALTVKEIEAICDAGTYETAELLQGNNIQILTGEVSRLVVDLNRFPDDKRNIGIFREKTFRGKKIFIKGKKFRAKEKKYYKEKYYNPWHEKFLNALTAEPLYLHIDLHNTDETKSCLSAYTPGHPLKMENFTDIDIANRSTYKQPYQPIDAEGLTFPSKEMDFFKVSMEKHMGKFIEKYSNRDPKSIQITTSSFMRGGPIIQIARNKAKWFDGVPRSLQLEVQRQFFVDRNNNIDPNKIKGFATSLNEILVDILNNLT